MKKYLVAGVALLALSGVSAPAPVLAADIPVKALPLFNWTGWYVGGNTGYSWGKTRYTFSSANNPNIASTSIGHDGWLGSVEGGYCWQQPGSNFVGCFEARYDFPREKGRGDITVPATPVTTISNNPEVDPILIGPHLGFTTDKNQTFWYLAGGLAVGKLAFDATITGGGPASASKWKAGWFVGAGVERMINKNWSWKVEYDYVRFSTGGLSSAFNPPSGQISTQFTPPQVLTMGKGAYDNIITFGINYHFGTR